MRLRPFLATLLSLGLTLACGGGSSRPATPMGNLSIQFGSDSLPGYSQAIVSLEKVEATVDGSTWVAVGSVKATFDLMALQNGRSVVILPATSVIAATYTQLRITWATVNYQVAINMPAYVVPSGGTGQILAMPVTTVVSGPVTVPANSNTTAQIMLSGQQAVQARASGTHSFQATGRVYDLAATARITGLLSQGTSSLPFTEVLAETVDGSGLATLQRRTMTDAFGNYTLEGLPTGSLYFVVAQPTSAILAYAAVAAAPVNATAATTYSANLTFSAPQSPGTLTLTITPPSSAMQGTWGELRQALPTGSTGSQILIVRSQTLDTGLTQDQTSFLTLFPGVYGVTAQRSTSGATAIMNTGSQVLVNAGATTNTSLSFP